LGYEKAVGAFSYQYGCSGKSSPGRMDPRAIILPDLCAWRSARYFTAADRAILGIPEHGMSNSVENCEREEDDQQDQKAYPVELAADRVDHPLAVWTVFHVWPPSWDI